MKLSLAAALLTLVAPVAASAAEIVDYNVYSAGSFSAQGGTYGVVASNGFSNAGGIVTRNDASTAALTAQANALSGALAALPTTTGASVVDNNNGSLTLRGTSTGTTVFNLTTGQLTQGLALNFANIGSGLVINVTGGGTFSNFVNYNLGAVATSNAVINFVDATALNLGGFNFAGTLLAPKAAVNLGGGIVQGQVIANSFAGAGATVNGTAFVGLPVAAAVPEPATWAMMILGFGMIGGLLRRRGAARPSAALA